MDVNLHMKENKNRHFRWASLLLCWMVLFCINSYADTLTIPLNSGRVYKIDQYPFKTVYIASPKIASLAIQTPGVLYITGVHVGHTTLYATDKFGNVILRKDIAVIPNVMALSDELHRIAPNSNVQVTTLGNNIILRGNIPSPGVGAKLREAAFRYAGRNGGVIDYMTIAAPAQVYIRVKIVELSRGVSRMIGLKSWSVLYGSSNFKASASNDVTSNGIINTINSLTTTVPSGFSASAFFEALDQDHLVRILSEPNLTALSGQQATFFAGGEFPILVPQTSGAGIGFGVNTVQYQQFGVSLNFIPTLLEQDIINLQVKTEVSQLSDEAVVKINGNTIPSLTSRRAGTTVQLRSGQSFAIAGLMQDSLRDAIERFPLLGRLPVLGPLFSSREFQTDQTELVVIVTPYLVRPVSGELATPIDGVSEADIKRRGCFYNPQIPGCNTNQPSQLRYITE